MGESAQACGCMQMNSELTVTHMILSTGAELLDVNLIATPRSVSRMPLPLSNIDAALCSSDGVRLFRDSSYYEYETTTLLTTSRMAPRPMPITSRMIGCRD